MFSDRSMFGDAPHVHFREPLHSSISNSHTMFRPEPALRPEMDLSPTDVSGLLHLPSTICFATGGVGTGLGIAGILVAFLALSAATGGIGGIVLAAISAAAVLGGLTTLAFGGLAYAAESMVEGAVYELPGFMNS